MCPQLIPYLRLEGSEVWALGLHKGLLRGRRFRAHTNGPCGYPKNGPSDAICWAQKQCLGLSPEQIPENQASRQIRSQAILALPTP